MENWNEPGYFVHSDKVYPMPAKTGTAVLRENRAFECDYTHPNATDDLRGRLAMSGTPVIYRTQDSAGPVYVGNMSYGTISSVLAFENAEQYNAYCVWSNTHDPEASVRQNASAASARKVYATREDAEAAMPTQTTTEKTAEHGVNTMHVIEIRCTADTDPIGYVSKKSELCHTVKAAQRFDSEEAARAEAERMRQQFPALALLPAVTQ